MELLADTETVDQLSVAAWVPATHVTQQAPPLADHLEQAEPPVMIVLVNFEMLGEVADAFGQHRNLDLGRSAVTIMLTERRDRLFLFLRW